MNLLSVGGMALVYLAINDETFRIPCHYENIIIMAQPGSVATGYMPFGEVHLVASRE